MPYADITKRTIHRTWRNMIWRCYRKEHISYKYYGERGITVCDEWLNDFQSFYDWALSSGYSKNLTLDRIDNDGNYEPSNCRWATAKEQANNTRANHLVTCNGETKTISEWAELLGITHQALSDRLNSKSWTIEDALTVKKKSRPAKQPSFRKAVYQKNTNNEILKKWDSISSAAKALNIHNGNISRALNNSKYTAGGYMWQYAD